MDSGPVDETAVETFVVKLKALDNDKKVDCLTLFGLRLDAAPSLPNSTFDAITLAISPCLKSTSHLLIQAVLHSFLPCFIPKLPISPPATHTHIRLLLVQILPQLLEKLNDPKEKVNSAARECIILLGKKCYEAEPTSATPSAGGGGAGGGKGKEKEGLVNCWERNIKDTLAGKGWRGKVEGMRLLLIMKDERGSKMSLKPWLPVLVDLLEDGDGNVRDQARETVVALLSPASTPPGARSELKKLLAARQVRKTILDNIMTRVFAPPSAIQPADVPLPPDDASDGLRSGAATPALGAGSGVVPTVGTAGEEIPVVYIASGRDLEHEFSQMIPFFQGKEDEHNWNPREKSVVLVRGMIRGQAFQHYPDAFVSGLKMGFMEGLCKTLVSLRTTVAQQSCALMQELAEALGSSLDPFVENLLPVLGKMAGYTKRIIADKSQKALGAIIIHSTTPSRLFISHIHAGIHEKNIQIRHACTVHLKTFFDVQAPKNKSHIENGANLLDLLIEATKKGLSDVNPGVREAARMAFWSFHDVWPKQARVIIDTLDGTARKQLDKANPRGLSGNPSSSSNVASTTIGGTGSGSGSGSGPVAEASRPSKINVAKKPSTAVQAMMAERRRALAAGRAAQETQRTVSSPVPNSASIPQGLPRSTSSTSIAGTPVQSRRAVPLAHSANSPSPNGSPVSRSSSTLLNPRDGSSGSPSSSRQHSGTSQLQSRDRLSRRGSASSSKGSPPSRSPLRQSSSPFLPESTTLGQGQPSSSSTSGTSGAQALRTPVLDRTARATGTGLGLDSFNDLNIGTVRTGEEGHTAQDEVIHEVQAATAAQGVSSAQQLLELNEDISSPSSSSSPIAPVTPARSNGTSIHGSGPLSTPGNANGNGNGNGYGYGHGYQTPMPNSVRRNVWEDSPGMGGGAVTPLMVDRLKGRRYERSWWAKRQQYLDKASPLRGSATASAAIDQDIKALQAGSPDMRNLQKLTLFATSHPITSGEEEEDDKKIWDEGRLFDRVSDGLLSFLQPDKPVDLLEQGLVLLWELVQHQYLLFEGKEMILVDALFRLRVSRNATILESTNSLISLLTETSDPAYFLGIVRSSLDKFISAYPEEASPSKPGNTAKPTASIASSGLLAGEKAKASGYLFGLNTLGMCIMRLPEAVVEVEGTKLAGLIMDAISFPVISARQAAHMLLLAIQCVLNDAHRTLSLVPGLNAGQKNLAMYLMESNGLLRGSESGQASAQNSSGSDEQERGVLGEEEERKERVAEEMAGLMSRGVA